ncbi:uncharacterized protein LOC144941952 [Lampetra fluviatilis]
MFQRLSGFLFPEEENPAPQSRRASSLTESDGDEGWIIIDLTDVNGNITRDALTDEVDNDSFNPPHQQPTSSNTSNSEDGTPTQPAETSREAEDSRNCQPTLPLQVNFPGATGNACGDSSFDSAPTELISFVDNWFEPPPATSSACSIEAKNTECPTVQARSGLKGPRTLEESWILPKRVGSPPAPLCPECSNDDEDFSFPDGRALAAEFSDGSSSQSEPSTPRGMEESWLLAPPPCFSAPGEGSSNRGLESSPLENLLIEHPSMSVYAAFRRRRPSGQPLHGAVAAAAARGTRQEPSRRKAKGRRPENRTRFPVQRGGQESPQSNTAPSSPRRAPRRSPASVAANAARSLLENARRLHRSTLVSLRSPRLQPSRRQLQRQNDARNRASFSGKHRGNVIKQPGFRSHKF